MEELSSAPYGTLLTDHIYIYTQHVTTSLRRAFLTLTLQCIILIFLLSAQTLWGLCCFSPEVSKMGCNPTFSPIQCIYLVTLSTRRLPHPGNYSKILTELELGARTPASVISFSVERLAKREVSGGPFLLLACPLSKITEAVSSWIRSGCPQQFLLCTNNSVSPSL